MKYPPFLLRAAARKRLGHVYKDIYPNLVVDLVLDEPPGARGPGLRRAAQIPAGARCRLIGRSHGDDLLVPDRVQGDAGSDRDVGQLYAAYTSTIVDEAQALLYGPGRLRTREMMTAMVFTMQQNYAAQTLPANFLDPIGPIYVSTFNTPIRHKDLQFVQRFTKASILRRSRPLFLARHSAAKRRPLAPAP